MKSKMGVPEQHRQAQAPKRRGRKRYAIAAVVAVVVLIHFAPAHTAQADAQSSQAWYSWIYDAFYSAMTKVFDWGIGKIFDLCDKAWAVVSPAIPAQLKNYSLTGATEYLSIANYWLPIAETCAAIVAYYIFQGALVIYRLIKSWLENGW